MEKATRVNAVRVGSVSINQRRKPCQCELARISKGLTHLLGHPCKYFSRHSWHAAPRTRASDPHGTYEFGSYGSG